MWLVTGGAGYVGSHVARAVKARGIDVLVLDDLSTGCSHRLPTDIPLRTGSCGDVGELLADLPRGTITGVIHLAGLKDARASMDRPLDYWKVNVMEMICLLDWARKHQVPNFLFSSSSSVYGTASNVTEKDPYSPVSTYGETKLVGEKVLRAASCGTGMRSVSLRYFNVIGADTFPSAYDTGSDNVVPQFTRAAKAKSPLKIYGTTHDTQDGSCVRDFVDVRDVAEAHVLVVERLLEAPCELPEVLNIASGQPSSVLQIAQVFQSLLSDRDLRVVIEPAKPGDPAEIYARTSPDLVQWGWQPRFSIEESIASHIAHLGF